MNEQLKKSIIDSLYESNFYKASVNIKKLEDEIGQVAEVFILYYFLYDLLEWVNTHAKDHSNKQIKSNKKKYFNKINKQNSGDESKTYVQLYIFLEENFRTFDRFTWFRKKDKSRYLLKQSLKKNTNNREAQFFQLFCDEDIEKCFEFLNKNILDTSIVEKFLNSSQIFFKEQYLDNAKYIRTLYKLDSQPYDFLYNAQKKNYEWLYDYFTNNKSEIYKTTFISFGKVCFELKKYDEAIKFYTDKDNKNNNDYYKQGECYEEKGETQKAIECYKNYYTNFQSGYWKDGIEKLFKLKAYDEVKDILADDKSASNKAYKIFYEAKILNIEKEYNDSINKLNSIPEISNTSKDLKKDIYLLYILNHYKKTMYSLKTYYKRIIENQDFELNNSFGITYSHLSDYHEFEKYRKKLNIEYNNENFTKTKEYKQQIHNQYIKLHKNLYKKIKQIDFELTEDRELYYLSAFDDKESLEKRISIYKKKVSIEPENPHHYLELGKLFYKKNNPTNTNYTEAIGYLKKTMELAQKYFINLNGAPELLLVRINSDTKQNKQFFDDSIKNFIFHNSYQKDAQTMFFSQVLYKYQSFSMNTLSSLTNHYLYFPNPNKLNDPFDIASESLEKNFNNLKISKTDFKTCSLSKNNNNKLMWSHYTNEHTGLCVGYKFLYLPSYVGKDEVQYKNTNLEEEDIFQNIIDYWTVKSEDWAYEQEVRLLHYGEQEKIPYTFDINQALKNKIIALQIVSITFGMKFNEYNIIKQIIKDIEKKQKIKIQTYKTKIINQKLVPEKIDL